MAETLNGYTRLCPHSDIWNLTWHGDICAVWLGDALMWFPKEESYVDNPLQCDHIHHTENIQHWGNGVLYDLVPDTENSNLPHEI